MRLSTTTCLFLTVSLLAFALSGCRTTRNFEKSEFERSVVFMRDSVFFFISDTVRIIERGDTVYFIEKKETTKEFHNFYRDTLRTSDTLIVEKTTERPSVGQEGMRDKRFPWFVAGVCVCLFIIFAAKIVIKFYTRK